MKHHKLNDMTVFIEVARANGFRAAAKALNLGPGSVSEAIQRFEDRLGVRLFERSTRRVVLTPAGERLYQRSLSALLDLENALGELDNEGEAVAGTLRLSAPYSAGPFFLNELLARFACAYPEVAVELFYSDEKVDLVAGGVDAVIRSHTLIEENTYAMAIGPELELALVAAPDYLDRNGMPKAPDEIVAHDGICFSFGRADRLAPWTFEGNDGVYSVAPRPRITANDLHSLVQYAMAGLGLAYVYADVIAEAVASGRLVRLFDKQIPKLPPYSLNYRTKRNMPKQLRAFIDFAKTSG